MRRLACAVSVIGALAAVPAPASASHDYGGCSWVVVRDRFGLVLNPDFQTAVVFTSVVGGTPVRCWLEINGSQISPATRLPGSGDGEGAEVYAYTVPAGSVVTLCEQVDVDSDYVVSCRSDPDVTVPPDPPAEVRDLVDPVICVVLQIVFPPEGDIPEIGWDCPPYVG